MKQYLLTFWLMLSLLLTGGCSKDDEPENDNGTTGGNGTTSNQFEVDGIKAGVKYGYAVRLDVITEYYFYDTDIMKYLNQGGIDNVDKEFTYINVDYDLERHKVIYVEFDYKVNDYRETGLWYESSFDTDDLHVSYSEKGSNVKIGADSIRMSKYNYQEDFPGWFTGSFSVDCSTKDITDIVFGLDTYSRSAEIVEVTDPEQVAFLKSMRSKNRKLSRNN